MIDLLRLVGGRCGEVRIVGEASPGQGAPLDPFDEGLNAAHLVCVTGVAGPTMDTDTNRRPGREKWK